MSANHNEKGQIIVKLNGGLGNQMFQWALGRRIQVSTDMDVYLDMSYFENNYARPYQLNVFNLQPTFVKDPLTKLKLAVIWTFRDFLKGQNFFGITLYSEKHFHFDRNIARIRSNTYIEGFFQSELYFKAIENQLRADFDFKPTADIENERLISKISLLNAVSLHIRRGDYVQKERYKNQYATCSLDYYKRGVEYIAQRYPNPTLFIFSDDIDWAKKNLKLPYECVFVSHNKGEKSYEDMRLMSFCKHNIIANSSFSWWGAWLNNNQEKIVIAPQRWFNDTNIIQTDVIPQSWIRLEN